MPGYIYLRIAAYFIFHYHFFLVHLHGEFYADTTKLKTHWLEKQNTALVQSNPLYQ